jgi:hypothetical protein
MNYRNYSDEQLVDNATPGQGHSLEMMRRLKNSLEKLDNSINDFNKASSKQQSVMIDLAKESGGQAEKMLNMTRRITGLTWAIAILTAILVIDILVKIYFDY